MKEKLLNCFFILNTSCFIISFSIAFLLLFRPFYYLHIPLLNLPEESGYTYQEIKEGYDSIMDYSFYLKPFSTGVFKHSKDGYSHFRDCRVLFTINFVILFLSGVFMLIKRKHYKNLSVRGHSIGFWSGVSILIFFLLILILSLIFGFDNCFTVFHTIFFLGKDNWLLDPDLDPIIYIFPEQFFMNCALLVLCMIFSFSGFYILKDLFHKKG